MRNKASNLAYLIAGTIVAGVILFKVAVIVFVLYLAYLLVTHLTS